MNKTIRDILYFGFAVILVKLIGMCTSILLARFLSPPNYGLWVTLTLLVSYSSIMCLGTVETMVKQYPFFAGGGEYGKAREIEDGVFGSIILAGIVLALIGGTIQWIVQDVQVREQLTLVRLMIGAAIIGLFSAYFYHRFVAHQNFRLVSLLESSRAFVTIFLVVLLTNFFGIIGTVMGYLCSEIILCLFSAFLSIRICGAIRPNINFRLLKMLVKIGFPITIVWWIFIIQTSVDRIFSMAMLGKAATGYFSLGVNILTVLVLIPQMIGRVLYPKINEEIGRGAGRDRIASLVILPTRMFSLVLPVGIGVLLMLTPFIYTVIFPKYQPGMTSAQILLLGVYFIAIIPNGINYLVSINRQNILLAHMLTCLVTNVAMNFLFIRYNLGINGIAASTAISQSLLASLIWLSVFKSMGFRGVRQFHEIVNIYLPFLLMLGLLAVIRWAFPDMFSHTGMQSLLPITLYAVLLTAAFVTFPPFRTWVREITAKLRGLKGKTDLKTVIV